MPPPAGADEQAAVLVRMAGIFERLGVRYCVGGSVASNAYGIFRATFDADFVAGLLPSHVPALLRELAEDFYVEPEAVASALQRRASFNVIHLATLQKVDVFAAKFDSFDARQLRRRVAQRVGPAEGDVVWFASPEDTILTKLDWYRQGGGVSDRQWGDVTGVMKVQAERLDLAYLREWAPELRVTDLLERALAESGLAA
jgi:hypothetical protein